MGKKKKECSGSLWHLLKASVAAEQSLTVDVTHARCPIHTLTEPPPLEESALIPVSTAHKQLGRSDCLQDGPMNRNNLLLCFRSNGTESYLIVGVSDVPVSAQLTLRSSCPERTVRLVLLTLQMTNAHT